MEYIIYCDESDSNGEYFSNFYGGLLIRSVDLQEVTDALSAKKNELNITGELKWQKVTSSYLSKYEEFTDLFLDFVAQGKVKVRIMFTQNIDVAPRYDFYRRDNKYFLLYYQFIKHSFGLRYANEAKEVRVRLYLDKLPDTKEKAERFKGNVLALNKTSAFRNAAVFLDKEQIAEIDSKQHILSQSLDIVLGAMQFRLNDKHKQKPEGSFRRGKRTIAKEKLYKRINSRVRKIYPNFNIGVSTSSRGALSNYWLDPYRHWVFKSSGASKDLNLGKKK